MSETLMPRVSDERAASLMERAESVGPLQVIKKGDAARTFFVTQARDGFMLHDSFLLECHDAGSGRDMDQTKRDALVDVMIDSTRDVRDLCGDLAMARERIAELERERDGLKSTIASRWSCGHARFPIALESHPECSECYKAERDRLSGQVAALRDVLERFKWAAAPEQHRGTSAYPYEEIVAVLSDTEQAAREHDERVRAAAITDASDEDLVRALNSRLVPCIHGHAPEMLALWPCHKCVRREAQKTALDHLELAWGIIANAAGGDWDHPINHPEWKAAAERWRDRYFTMLPSGRAEAVRRAAEQEGKP